MLMGEVTEIGSKCKAPGTMFWFIYFLIFLIGLAQTPLLVDLLRLIFPTWRIKRLTNNFSVYLLRILMTTFFFTGLAQHVFVFVPLFPDVSFRSLKLAAHCVFAYWVWLNMTVNYYLATFLSPGYCADVTQSESESSKDDSPSSDNTLILPTEDHSTSSGQTIDSSTNITASFNQDLPASAGHVLPPVVKQEFPTIGKRCHYCKICCKTVLYMDHHCPFTGNCVGVNNYSHFLLCLVYAWIGLGYGISASLFYFGECWFPTAWRSLGFAYLNGGEFDENKVCSTLAAYKEYIFPVGGGFTVLMILLAFQTFMLLSDLSTYDVLKNFWKQPIFKLGLKRVWQHRYRDKESRLNVLLFQRCPSILNYVLPIRNWS